MSEKGYTIRAKVTDDKWQAYDYIFVKKGFNEHVLLPNIHNPDTNRSTQYRPLWSTSS